MKSPLHVHGAPPRIGVVAGHDPRGAAGVLADADAVRAAGASASLCVTAWTEQDDEGVQRLGARPPMEWLEEARTMATHEEFCALKLGLLPGATHVRAAATWISELRAARPDLPVVVDPVLTSSSGFRFVDDEGLEAYRVVLAPMGLLWTPNLIELGQLTGSGPLLEETDRLEAARELLRLGVSCVVAKGGHGGEDPVRELVLDEEGATWLEHPRVEGGVLRGSGCRHATTLAVELARGGDRVSAARVSASFVRRRIEAAPRDPWPGYP